jgi:hypothetical protein
MFLSYIVVWAALLKGLFFASVAGYLSVFFPLQDLPWALSPHHVSFIFAPEVITEGAEPKPFGYACGAHSGIALPQLERLQTSHSHKTWRSEKGDR